MSFLNDQDVFSGPFSVSLCRGLPCLLLNSHYDAAAQVDSKTDHHSRSAASAPERKESFSGRQGFLSHFLSKKMHLGWMQRIWSNSRMGELLSIPIQTSCLLKVVPAMTECWSVDPWAAEAPRTPLRVDLLPVVKYQFALPIRDLV